MPTITCEPCNGEKTILHGKEKKPCLICKGIGELTITDAEYVKLLEQEEK